MCATKCDLEDNPDTSQAEALAAQTGSMFLKTSSKTNSNVQLLFQKVTERVLDYQRRTARCADIPVTVESTGLETKTPPITPTRPPNNNAQTIGNDDPKNSTPVAAKEKGKSAHSPFADEKKIEFDYVNEVIDDEDDERRISISDDSSIKHVTKSRCDAKNLMCGEVVGVSEDGSLAACVIQ